MANTPSQQTAPEEALKAAKALWCLQNGIFPYPRYDNGKQWTHIARVFLVGLDDSDRIAEATKKLYAAPNQRAEEEWWPTPVDALAAAYDAIRSDEKPAFTVVPLVPCDLIKVMGNTIYFSTPAEAHPTSDGKWVWLSWSGGAEILHSLEPVFTGKPVKPQ